MIKDCTYSHFLHHTSTLNMHRQFFLVLTSIALLAGASMAKHLCSQSVVALASGIHLNIVGQIGEWNQLFKRKGIETNIRRHLSIYIYIGELKTVRELQAIQTRQSAHGLAAEYIMVKGILVANIEGGMMIRSFNQQVLPKGNAASSGLEIVAKAQLTELNLAKSLNGQKNHDGPILATLARDIVDGTAQNRRNLKAVSGNTEANDLKDCYTNH